MCMKGGAGNVCREGTGGKTLAELRLNVLDWLLWTAAALGPFMLALAILDELSGTFRIGALVAYTVAYGLIVLAVAKRRLGVNCRGAMFLVALYIIGVVSLRLTGLSSPTSLYLFAFVLFAGMLFGFRIGLLAFALASLSLGVAAWLCLADFWVIHSISNDHVLAWLTTWMSFTCTSAAALVSLTVLLLRLDRSMRSALALAADLKDEAAARQQAEETVVLKDAVFDSSLAANSIADTHGIITEVNAAFLRLWNCSSAADVVGKPIAAFVANDVEMAAVSEALNTSGEWEGDLTAKRADASSFTAHALATVLRDDSGSVVGYQSSVVDITSRRRVEEALRASEEKYRILIETTSTGYVILDMAGRVLDANDEYVRIAGYERLEQILGRSVTEWTAACDQERNAEEVRKCMAYGSVKGLEISYVHTDGSVVPIEINASTLDTDTGTRIVTLCRNITERKKTEGELQQLASVIRHSQELVNLATLDGRMLFLNEAGVRMLGIEPADVQHTSIFQAVSNETKDRFRDEILPALMTEGLWIGDLQYVHHGTGGLIDVHAMLFTVNDPLTGVPQYLANVSLDITEHRRTETAILREKQFSDTVINGLPGIFFVFDANGRLLRWNENHERVLGYSPEEMRQLDIGQLASAKDRAAMEHATRDLFEKGYGALEMHIQTRTGEQIPYSIAAVRMLVGDDAYMVGTGLDISDRKRMEEERRRDEARLRSLVDILQHPAPTIQALLDYALDCAIELTESAIGYIYFYHEDRKQFVLNTWSKDVMKECSITNPESCYELDKTGLWGEAVRQRKPIVINDFETDHPLKKGYPEGHATLHRFMTAPVFSAGRIVAVIGVANKEADYTETDLLQLTLLMDSVWAAVEHKRSEEENENLQAQLLQAKKMESVGRLAGGVAHDFNNILSVILGHTELALEQIDDQHPLHDDLREVLAAAQRSAGLTRQLLAFARRQTVVPKVLDLNDTVDGMLKMLRRLIGEDIDLRWKPGRDVWPIWMDPAQIDQVLVNLCVNARDAIGGVGAVTIETGSTTLDETFCIRHVGATPGEYAQLTVSDTGCGMEKSVLEHVFEPFYTTKGVGEGTGLGLATVYGIIKQNKGQVDVYSEPGRGTTFRIYLPRYMKGVAAARQDTVAEEPRQGRETVLLVEDEPAILGLSRRLLEKLGYHVLSAGTPAKAIQVAESHDGEIQLLITDVIMPEMNGRDLANRVLVLRPGIRCLFMSGYTADVIAYSGVVEEGVQFIQKPFSLQSLASKVREALDGA